MLNTEHETEIQKKLLEYFSNPAEVYQTSNGKRIQILSPGKINKFEGPDFKNMAIMSAGTILVGDAEFHRDSGDWYRHRHDQNPEYENVILHMVFDNKDIPENIDTLVLDENEISSITLGRKESEEIDLKSVEDLQHYALMRLLRKSAEVKDILENNTLLYTLKESVRGFLERYFARRRRPVYTPDLMTATCDNLEYSYIFKFLSELEEGDYAFIPDKMQMLMKTKIKSEGAALRREIILNCVLPLSLCLASEEARINLLFWFWSTPALNSYGNLTSNFPRIPQNFLWQQQGMLEYMRYHKGKILPEEDITGRYNFANTLGFFGKKK